MVRCMLRVIFQVSGRKDSQALEARRQYGLLTEMSNECEVPISEAGDE